MAFCSSCGEELIEGDLFCRSCGAPIEQTKQTVENQQPTGAHSSVAYEYQAQVEDPLEALTPTKCPACGEPLGSGVEFCPACNYPIASVSSSDAVNDFMQLLSLVEADASDGTVSYTRVVREIDAFAIPRTANGVLAFLVVAKGRLSSSVRDYGQGPAAKDAISQAWAAKAQHAYDVACLLFPSAAEFGDIDALYKDVRAIASRNDAVRGVASAVGSVKNSGCLAKLIVFNLALIVLPLVLDLVAVLFKHVWLGRAALLLAVVGAVYYYKNKTSK